MSKHILHKHTSGFTTVSNNVIKILKHDLGCLGLYLYLLSLPDNWEFYKTHLAKDTKIGIKKLEKFLKKLGSFGLVQCVQKRDTNGQFSHFDLAIYDLETIKNNNLVNMVQPEGQNDRTAETVGRFGEAIKEVYTKEESAPLLEENKRNIYRPSKSDGQNKFDIFWSIYPRKQKKKRAHQIWVKNKLDNISDKIIDSVKKKLDYDWKDKNLEFIPLPDAYLNQERWNDEIELNLLTKNNEQAPRSAVNRMGFHESAWKYNQ